MLRSCCRVLPQPLSGLRFPRTGANRNTTAGVLFQQGGAGLGGKLSSFVGSFSFGRARAAPSLLRPLLGASGEGGDDEELCPTPVGKMMDSAPPAKIRRGGWLPSGMSQCPTAAK